LPASTTSVTTVWIWVLSESLGAKLGSTVIAHSVTLPKQLQDALLSAYMRRANIVRVVAINLSSSR
jgi:glyceraldehyde-3-phosphate dehydrogenase/erythrose-4-phosphate dehydrogenase